MNKTAGGANEDNRKEFEEGHRTGLQHTLGKWATTSTGKAQTSGQFLVQTIQQCLPQGWEDPTHHSEKRFQSPNQKDLK